MKIAIGGMQKNEMKDAILKACPEVETIVTTDMGAVPMLKDGRADYYFGACESGGGSSVMENAVLSVKTVESRTDLRLRALSRRERYVLG